MNVRNLANFFIFVLLFTFWSYSYAFNDLETQTIEAEKFKEDKLLINNDVKSDSGTYESKHLKSLIADLTKKVNSKSGKKSDLKNVPVKLKKFPDIKKRSIKIDETFVLTDKTRANTFRIISEKEWEHYEDKLMISFDIFGQDDDNGKLILKKQRFEFNYTFFISNFHENMPFAEYYFSTDEPTRVNWKVLSLGIGKNFPLGLKFDVGYGFKWGEISEKEIYKYDVATMNLSNKRKFSNLTLNQNFKIITPRRLKDNKQPIYDYKTTFSVPISKHLSGTVSFDWRYQKISELKKEDWASYSLKFGLTFFPKR